MFSVLMARRRDPTKAPEQKEDNEARDEVEETTVGLGDGCSYKISTFWFRRIGLSSVDSICRTLARGGASHLSVTDDKQVVRVEFFSYLAYLDREVRSSSIATTLFAALFNRMQKERERSTRSWNNLIKHMRSDVALAAMRLGLLRRVSLEGLVGEDDAAAVSLTLDSTRLHWAARHPDRAVMDLEASVNKVVGMRQQKKETR